MREQFEKLPHILEFMQYVTCFDGLKYVSDNQRTADYLNGAWYAYQEQQKKIDMQECGAEEIISIINSITPYEYDLDTMSKINKIKELLK